MAPSDDYEGLTDEELAELAASSEQLPNEDSSSWAARAAKDAASYKELAAERRAAQVAEPETEEAAGLTHDASSAAGTDTGPATATTE